VVELFVGWNGERFALVEGPPSSDPVAALAPALRPGEEGIASPAALAFVDAAAAVLDGGYVLVIDYASAPTASGASGSTLVHGYRRHRVEADVLEAPGSRDITAGVDFGAIARRATELGLTVWGPVSQRDAMFALGFRDWDAAARARQIEAAEGRRGIEMVRVYNARSRASLLIDPLGLGGLQCLCLGVGVTEAPVAFRAA
jgi:SAM-dependent MidA family methyltransferase